MTALTEQSPAIEVSNLRKVYGSGHTEVVAISDATLQIGRGEMVGLFGASGSGKSTLLTAMALINPPTSDQIVIGGQPVMDGPRAMVDARAFRRQNIGFVFQKPNLITFSTAVENVQIALEINDPPANKAHTHAGTARLPRHPPNSSTVPRMSFDRVNGARWASRHRGYWCNWG